ncbi:MAG: M23 family metallopeptidase [Spirochaetes bacterium]|nr:M23 family metallopeptidase [Spirochaetota bacterium]
MTGWPITKYQVAQVKKYAIIISTAILSVLLLGNIIAVFVVDRVKADPKSYVLKEGFPFFTSAADYIKIIKSYPHDLGTKITIHRMKGGESFWDVAIRNHVSIETLIAANPFLDSLVAKEDIDIIVPAENGVLIAADNLTDVLRMSLKIKYKESINGDYIQSVFRILSLDDIRFAFFKDSMPEIVNDGLEKLYSMKKLFQSPVPGYFSSMYGTRVDPILGGLCFHSGIDIRANSGTPIYAAREGFVSSAGWMGQFGLSIIILHRDGYETMYGHCSAINVKAGDWVTKEDVIGKIGITGRATGPHLHFSIKRHGNLLDPLLFIW